MTEPTNDEIKEHLISLSVMLKAERTYVDSRLDDESARKGALYIINRVEKFLEEIDCKV